MPAQNQKTNAPIYVLVLAVVILGIAVIAATVTPRFAYPMSGWSQAQQTMPQISVSATGVASGTPTQAQIGLYVNGSGATGALATSNLSATLQTLNSTLAPFVNGNMSLVQTTSYTLYKTYNKTSYVATEGISVTLPNVSNTSAFLGAVSLVPNVYVQSAQPTLSNAQITTLRQHALQYALLNATNQATALVGNAALTVKTITVSYYTSVPFPGINFAAASTQGKGPVFYNGLEQVTGSVQVVFTYSP